MEAQILEDRPFPIGILDLPDSLVEEVALHGSSMTEEAVSLLLVTALWVLEVAELCSSESQNHNREEDLSTLYQDISIPSTQHLCRRPMAAKEMTGGTWVLGQTPKLVTLPFKTRGILTYWQGPLAPRPHFGFMGMGQLQEGLTRHKKKREEEV